MIREIAEVVAIDGTRIKVSTALKTGCSGCAQVKTCGAGMLSSLFENRRAEFELETDLPLQLGDRVELQIPEQVITGFSLLLYGLPLLMLLSSALVLQLALQLPEGTVIVGAFTITGLTFWGLRRYFRGRDVHVTQGISIHPLS